MNIVFEYFFDNDDYIIGWITHPAENRPEFQDNPIPIAGMNYELYDRYGLPQFKIINKEIIKESQIPSEHLENLSMINKTALFKIVKAICAGIKNGPTDVNFIKLNNIIEKIKNGF